MPAPIHTPQKGANESGYVNPARRVVRHHKAHLVGSLTHTLQEHPLSASQGLLAAPGPRQ